MNMDSESHPLRKFYRNITFDTLKERHDNFSFNKAIKTKQVIHDTMHFQNLLNKPTDPVMVVYKKKETDKPDYQNGEYQTMSENSTMYNEFQKRMQAPGSRENAMARSNYSGFSGSGPNLAQQMHPNTLLNNSRRHESAEVLKSDVGDTQRNAQ